MLLPLPKPVCPLAYVPSTGILGMVLLSMTGFPGRESKLS